MLGNHQIDFSPLPPLLQTRPCLHISVMNDLSINWPYFLTKQLNEWIHLFPRNYYKCKTQTKLAFVYIFLIQHFRYLPNNAFANINIVLKITLSARQMLPTKIFTDIITFIWNNYLEKYVATHYNICLFTNTTNLTIYSINNDLIRAINICFQFIKYFVF